MENKTNISENGKQNKFLHYPLLYRAAQQGTYGKFRQFTKSSITDALFVYFDGTPEAESTAALDGQYKNRPLACMTEAWEAFITKHYPEAAIYHRYMMKPRNTFRISESKPLPDGYRLAKMDETAFNLHPFSHGENYPSYASFKAEGSGFVVYYKNEIVSAASSFLSLNGEVELDVSTTESHRGKGLAEACISAMLQDCMERKFIVHWDAQNKISLHLAEKYGFELEQEYLVYWLTA